LLKSTLKLSRRTRVKKWKKDVHITPNDPTSSGLADNRPEDYGVLSAPKGKHYC
jgi:hypothetical protein